MTVFLLKTEEIEALPREFCERNFPGRLKGSVRARAIGAGAMIRYLTGLPETDIRYNENGKPYTENGPHFNISHSRDLVAGVSSEAPVGIDLEHTGRNHEGVEKRVFSPEERNLINSGEDDRLFFTAWTLKGKNLLRFRSFLSYSRAKRRSPAGRSFQKPQLSEIMCFPSVRKRNCRI